MVFLSAAAWESAAHGSCGDWLQHSSSPATSEPRPVNLAQPFAPVCQGPGCSQAPQHEKSTPASPIKLIRTDQHWAVWLELMQPEASSAPRATVADDRVLTVFVSRLERPPRG